MSPSSASDADAAAMATHGSVAGASSEEEVEEVEDDTFELGDQSNDPGKTIAELSAPVGAAAMFRMKGALRHRMTHMAAPMMRNQPTSDGDAKAASASSTPPALSPIPGSPASAVSSSSRRRSTMQATCEEFKAKNVMKELMTQKCGSTLKAWITHFDRNLNGQCNALEFRSAMKALKFTGAVESVWEELDEERLDEITLDVIDPESASVWLDFRKWCGATFDSPRDMIRQIRRAAGTDVSVEALSLHDFVRGIVICGWDPESAEELFLALDSEDEQCLRPRDLRWLDLEVRRREAKLAAKQRFAKERQAKASAKLACQRAVKDFKDCLQRQYGCTYHAWRRLLDPDGTMSLQKVELFKACRNLNWKGDVRSLWRALDFDNSGSTTLEELDPRTAQQLAQLKAKVCSLFGAKPSAALWAVVDRRRSWKLSYQHFVHELTQLGLSGRLKTMARWIDYEGKKYITESDLKFLDTWKPPQWLVAKPNPDAAERLKRLLKQKYGHYLKAWRSAMDKDNSNTCNWHEFLHAAQIAKFSGDVAGAWLHLDQDVAGTISFEDLDPGFYASLMQFKSWCIEEFGGVRAAFKTMDTDGSNELTYKEFRLALREYGFPGDAAKLFASLDQTNEKRLQYKEIQFLDLWDLPADCAWMQEDGLDTESTVEPSRGENTVSTLLDYRTPNPGPGSYEYAPSFGATPMTPTARHAGAWSFRGRDRNVSWLSSASTVGPAHYMASSARSPDNPEKRRVPCWAMARSYRFHGGIFEAPVEPVPGPGAYETKAAFQGPQFSMGTRLLVTVHPIQRATTSVIAAFPMSGTVPAATPRRLRSSHCR